VAPCTSPGSVRHDGAWQHVQRPGRIAEPFSQEGLAYQAFRHGHPNGAQHLAMNAFDKRDLAGYRYWLARAAKSGDGDAVRELRRFELRLPHTNAPRRSHLQHDRERP